jgi:putative membrane protein
MATDDESGAPVSTPTAEAPTEAPERKGFYVSPWILGALGVVVLAAVAVVIGFAVSDGGDGDHRGFGVRFGEHHGGRGHVLGIIVLLVLIALVITAAVLVARRYRERSTDVGTTAERILAERFARGEIDEADFLSRRAALRSQ